MRSTYSLALIALVLCGLSLRAQCPVPPMGQSPKPPYRWVPEGADTFVLKLGDVRLGLYDARSEIYRHYESDGTLSKPKPLPWKKDKTEEESTTPSPSPVVTPEPAERNPWITYGIGGGIFGVLLLLALLVQVRG